MSGSVGVVGIVGEVNLLQVQELGIIGIGHLFIEQPQPSNLPWQTQMKEKLKSTFFFLDPNFQGKFSWQSFDLLYPLNDTTFWPNSKIES